MYKHNYKRQLIALLLICLAPSSVYSATIPRSDQDFMLLPPFCSAKMRELGTEKSAYWHKKIGRDTYMHLHHLCNGLHGINILQTMSSRKTQYNRVIRSSLGGIDYVLDRTNQNIPLYPYMLLKKAEVLILAKQPGEAIKLLEQAISIRSNYTPAYIKLSGIYKQRGNKNAAKEILTQGLKQNPKSKVLQKRLKEL